MMGADGSGHVSGYRISWEEYNRTNTRVTHYLPNVTLEYRVTGLTALTTYTIEVAAMTSKGQGQVSSSTISSGVPPGERGGAGMPAGCERCWGRAAGAIHPALSPQSSPVRPPTWASPTSDPAPSPSSFARAMTAKPPSPAGRWRRRYGGAGEGGARGCWGTTHPTPIPQVGQNGEAEEWGLVHQLANEPDARSMEVPNLKPYTYYRRVARMVPWHPPQGTGALLPPAVTPPSRFSVSACGR